MLIMPEGSIYLAMYTWGLKNVDINEIEQACAIAGKPIRQKDYQNYYNGLYKHWILNPNSDPFIIVTQKPPKDTYENMTLSDYPENPLLSLPLTDRRWVPCDKNNKPLVKWSREMFSYIDAWSHIGCVYVGENLRGGQHIVIDCDGDHDPNNIDYDLLEFMWPYSEQTHTLSKPQPEGSDFIPTSFHLTFWTDRVIPTFHFPQVHIDICGNKNNQLRYWKNKVWNQKEPANLTSEIWENIKQYIERRTK